MATNKPSDSATVVAPIKWSDLKSFIEEQIKHVSASYDKLYKNYFLDASDRAIELKKDDEERRTNITSPMTLMFVDKIANVLIKMGGRFVVTDLDSEKRGEKSEDIIDEMLEVADTVMKEESNKDAIEDMIKDMSLLGIGTGKISYIQKEESAKYIDYSGKTKKVTKYKDMPTIDYVSGYNFFPYYHTSNLDEAVFIAERMLMTKAKINELAKSEGITIDWNKVEKEYKYIDDRDFNAIKNGIPFYGYNMGEHADKRVDERYRIDKNKKMYEVVSLNTQTHSRLYINGYEVGPFESKEQRVLFGYRYRSIRFRKLTGSVRAIGPGHFLAPLQHEYDVITNSRIDNVLMAVNKAFIVSNDVNLGNNSNRVKMGPGKAIKAASKDSVTPLNVGEVPGSSYKETDTLFSLAQGISGIVSMALGMQNKVERVAGSSEMLKSAIDDQLIEAVNSIARLRTKLFKDIIVLTLAYMKRDQLAKILGKDNLLQDIDIDTIVNDYEFSFEPDTETTKMSAVTLQLLINYLNTVAGLADKNGKPIANAREIAEKIRDMMGLPDDMVIDDDGVFTNPQGMPAAPEDGAADITALQQTGGAGELGDFATNSEGVNTPPAI